MYCLIIELSYIRMANTYVFAISIQILLIQKDQRCCCTVVVVLPSIPLRRLHKAAVSRLSRLLAF